MEIFSPPRRPAGGASDIEPNNSLWESVLGSHRKEGNGEACRFSPEENREILSLQREDDPHLRGQGLVNFGRRLQSKGKIDAAARVYQAVAELSEDPASKLAAASNLKSLQGAEDVGSRIEFLLNRFVSDACDPRKIAPMMLGSVVYGLARSASLGRLISSSRASWLTRGRGAKAVAGLIGFAAEVPAFTLSGRGLRSIDGENQGQELGFARDLAASAMTLGALKVFGITGTLLARRIPAEALPPALVRSLNFALSQGAMFFGMLAAHLLEESLGLRPRTDKATMVAETLSAMLSLGAGVKLGRHFLGKGLSRFQAELELRARASFYEGRKKSLARHPALSPLLSPLWMAVGAGGSGGIGPDGGILPERKVEVGLQARNLRGYQSRMLGALESDIQGETAPWLGLAAPMQTGKSYLIGPIIAQVRRKFGPRARIIVLSSARVITDQLLKDLVGRVEEPVGRFDADCKETRQNLIVASAMALSRHLEEFSPESAAILVNDEAYSTQAPTFRKIYEHFGMGEVRRSEGASFLVPREGKGLVIGLSGTGAGLAGYHISHQMNLSEAIELGAIRQMIGERIAVDLASEEKGRSSEGAMIWWLPTRENAEALAEIYAEKIHASRPKSLVFVPTIRHGELFLEALGRRFGDKVGRLVHSRMSDEEFFDSLGEWRENGGPLVSIKRIGRGFRATGADAVFHTYQTSSPELYAQRTGRAWGKTSGEQPDLYVLEVAWNRRSSFANLARLLGLVDYPGPKVSSRNLQRFLKEDGERQERRKDLEESVKRGAVSPIFVGIPMVEGWRQEFKAVLERAGGVSALSEASGVGVEILSGFALGALPLRMRDVSALSNFLGGRERAASVWLNSWHSAVEEMIGGRLRLNDRAERELLAWRESWRDLSAAGAVDQASAELERILSKNLRYFSGGGLRGRISTHEVSFEDMQALAEISPPDEIPLGWSDMQWRRAWRRAVMQLEEKSQDRSVEGPERGKLEAQGEKLVQHFFSRQGWNYSPKTAQERMLYWIRREVAVKFLGVLPEDAANNEGGKRGFGYLQNWVDGFPMVYTKANSPNSHFRRLRALLKGLGWSPSRINNLLAPAVFEERGWKWEGKTSQERLLRESRFWIAVKLGGNLPYNWDFFEGRGRDSRHKFAEAHLSDGSQLVPLNEWLQSGRRPEVYERNPYQFYSILTRLLLSIGVREKNILPFVMSAVQEEWGQSLSASRMSKADVSPEENSREESLFDTLLWLRLEHQKVLPGIQIAAEFPPPLERKTPLDGMVYRSESARLAEYLAWLSPGEARILKWYFGLEGEVELTLEEIGQKVGLSRERIRQLREGALEKIRKNIKLKALSDGEKSKSMAKRL